jgi:hypothetical protein
MRTAPHCEDAFRWLKHRGWSLVPLTSQDRSALNAISHCWELAVRADVDGQRAAVDAAAALLDGCQEIVWPMARELIAQVGNWAHRDRIWPHVVRRFEERASRRIGPASIDLRATERVKRLARCHEGLSQVEPRHG